jgi:hypothetical protein
MVCDLILILVLLGFVEGRAYLLYLLDKYWPRK